MADQALALVILRETAGKTVRFSSRNTLNSLIMSGPIFGGRSPEILLPSLDVHEQLVQIPRVANPGASAPERPRIRWIEGLTPLSDRLVGDGDAALGEQILSISKAQAEAMVESDRVADNLGRKPVTAVAWHLAHHPSTLPATLST